jgi:glycosyltransferase involved in cell wall biosynthesis
MGKTLKIAYLVSHYPHKAFGHDGGLGTSVFNLVERLRKENIELYVFVYGQNSSFVIEEENLKIYSIKDVPFKFFKWYLYRKHIQNFINEIINAEQINLVEAPDWTGITAFMKFKIPLVIRFHGSDTYFCHLERRKQKWKNFWFENIAIHNAKAFIAPTAYAGEVSKRLFNIKNKTIKTIHHGLELDKFEKLSATQFEDGLILYLGTIIRKKGVLELPEIIKHVVENYPKARLVLIGGDANDTVTKSPSTWGLIENQLSMDLKHRVTYVGKVPYEEVQSYIKKAHVCVFPTFAETLGMVTIESMAMQKAVVNSNIGWAQELIVDGESGFLEHPTNHKVYASKIVELLKNDELRKSIGIKARERVEEVFDIDKKVIENIQFYKSLIS